MSFWNSVSLNEDSMENSYCLTIVYGLASLLHGEQADKNPMPTIGNRVNPFMAST